MIIVPKTFEQEKIANSLSDVDALIENLKKFIRKKKDIRQGTMQMLVNGKKRLDGFDGDWQTTTLDKLCRLVTKQTGFDYSAEIKPSLVTAPQIGTIPFIQNKDFEAFDINYNTDFFIPYDVAEKYPKGNLVVFVDECHRTQSGKLHTAMKTIMPNAVFIGFTGTPLLKKDKKISIEVFGTYIHAYKYNEGVADGVVLDLRYEYRDVPQDLSSQDRVDQWFDVKTRGLSSRAKAKLKEKWGTMQNSY